MPGHGKGWLRIAIDDYIETSPAFGFIGNWIQKGIEWLETALFGSYLGVLDNLPTIEGLELELQPKEIIRKASEHPGGLAALGGFGVSMGMGAASSFLAPVFRTLNYAMDKGIRSARVDPSVAFAMALRNPTIAGTVRDGLEELGWSEDLINSWFLVLAPRAGISELINMWFRDIISETELDNELAAKGWFPEHIGQLKELAQVIPGVGDLISMAVREAWRDDVAARFDYDADFPTEVVEWAEKQGLSADWVKRYWRAHWVLPSIGQGFGMLHRLRPGTTDNPFTMDDLQTLLRISDIPAFFRQRLTEIAYTPLTRVDVRRMYGMGVLDEDGIYNAYLDGGYNEKNAQLMTDFTIKYETQEQRELTRAVITSAYERQVMIHAEARTSLIDIGYSEVNADLFLAIADTKIAERRAKDRLARAEFLYLEGEIDETGVYAELGDLNLPADQTAELIVMWEIAKQKKISLPTKSELEDLYKRDIITRDQYDDGMVKRRYDKDTIAWYIERLDMRVAEDAAKDMERAQKEQERIEKADFASVYQRMKAAMDVEIASIKLEIADIKLAINYMEVATEIKAAVEFIFELKRDIAAWNLAKAEIKMQSTQPATTEG